MISKFAVMDSASSNLDSSTQYPEIVKNLSTIGLIETDLENCEGIIYINYNRNLYKKCLKFVKNKQHTILIRLEPFAVFPSQYRKSIERKFGLIIDPGKALNDKMISNFTGWPYKYHLNPSKPRHDDPNLDDELKKIIKSENFDILHWERRLNKIVMIAGNKVSPTSKSNYRLRRKVARQLKSNEIDVFGDMWEFEFTKRLYHRLAVGFHSIKSGFFPNIFELFGGLFTKYKTARGPINNKHELLQNYKFSLIIENTSNYCSEKLFDAILNGSIPIYVGPKNSEISLPDNLYFWCDGSIAQIRNFVNSLSQNELTARLKCMKEFVSSESFENNWASDTVYKKICVQINKYWEDIGC